MGQSKGGGYTQKETLLPEQLQTLLQSLTQSQGNIQSAAQGYNQFLPGGNGGNAIKEQAMRDYQQKTIPSILNAFGTGSKGSTSLNQALASSGADLNTNLASLLSQLQLSAAQGIGNLGITQQQQGLSTPGFAYLQRQPPIWENVSKGALSGATAGSTLGPWGALGGGTLGGILGAIR